MTEFFSRLFRSSEASTAPVFAMLLATICVMIGTATDILRANSFKAHLQDALDATVLALAPAGQSIEAGKQAFLATYERSAGLSTLLGEPTVEFVREADGQVAGTAQARIKAPFLSFSGFNGFKVAVAAKAAPMTAANATKSFEILSIKGWFAKDVFALELDNDGNVVNETKVASYDYDSVTDVHTVQPPLAVASDIVTSSSSNTVFKMRVWPVYTEHSSRDAVTPIDYRSDDVNARLKHHGSCEDGEYFEWEDAPNDIDTSQDDYADLVFKITCKTDPQQHAGVRLTN